MRRRRKKRAVTILFTQQFKHSDDSDNTKQEESFVSVVTGRCVITSKIAGLYCILSYTPPVVGCRKQKIFFTNRTILVSNKKRKLWDWAVNNIFVEEIVEEMKKILEEGKKMRHFKKKSMGGLCARLAAGGRCIISSM